MKQMSLLRSALALMAATALVQVTPAFAQAGGGGAGGAGGGGQAGGQGGGRRGGGPIANFSEEQRAALRQLGQDNRELNTKLSEARKELNAAIYAETVNEAAIREKSAAVAKIEADVAVARAKGFAKIRDKFSAEEIESLKNAPAFGGGGFGGRGGGGPGGGGGGGGQGGAGGANRRPPGGGAAQ